jgi:ParB/RepB/Spo0J family partition protein
MTTEIDETTSNLPEGLTLDEHGNMQAPLSILRVKAGFNPRQDATPTAELLAGVKESGVTRPIHIRDNPEEPGTFLIIDGERRFNAATKAKSDNVPVKYEGEMDDDAALILALMSNDNHAELSDKEIADAFQRLKDADVSEKEIARLMGCEVRKVKETLRVLEKGSEELKTAVKASSKKEKITPRAAARAADLPEEVQKEVVPKMKGKSTKEATKVVRDAEKKIGAKKRGRKADEYPFAAGAKKLCQLLERVAKYELKTAKAVGDQKRAQAMLEAVDLFKGKGSVSKLFPEAYKALDDQDKVQAEKEKQAERKEKAEAKKAGPSKSTPKASPKAKKAAGIKKLPSAKKKAA